MSEDEAPIAVLDANVLYSAQLRHLLIWLADANYKAKPSRGPHRPLSQSYHPTTPRREAYATIEASLTRMSGTT